MERRRYEKLLGSEGTFKEVDHLSYAELEVSVLSALGSNFAYRVDFWDRRASERNVDGRRYRGVA